MKRTRMRRRTRLGAKKQLRRSKPLERTASMAASERQRAAVAGRSCIVCGPRTHGSTRRTCYPEERPLGRAFFLLVLLSACRQRSG